MEIITCLLIKSIRPHPKRVAVMFHPDKSQFTDINDVFDAVFSASNPVSVLPVSTGEAQSLDNRGATFPDNKKSENNDLRKHVSERWKLKHEVVGILRKPENKKEDGSSYAVCGCGYGAVFKNDDGELKGVEQIDVYRRYSCDDVSKYKVGVSGALRCNSPWLCPTCAPKKLKNVGKILLMSLTQRTQWKVLQDL